MGAGTYRSAPGTFSKLSQIWRLTTSQKSRFLSRGHPPYSIHKRSACGTRSYRRCSFAGDGGAQAPTGAEHDAPLEKRSLMELRAPARDADVLSIPSGKGEPRGRGLTRNPTRDPKPAGRCSAALRTVATRQRTDEARALGNAIGQDWSVGVAQCDAQARHTTSLAPARISGPGLSFGATQGMEAKPVTDVASAIAVASQRGVPCICERQFDEDEAHDTEIVGVSESRGIPVYHIECRKCWREWRRIIW